jgi:hypothetical protein
MNRLASCETNCSPLSGRESLPELDKRSVATFKKRAEGEIWQIGHAQYRLNPCRLARIKREYFGLI